MEGDYLGTLPYVVGSLLRVGVRTGTDPPYCFPSPCCGIHCGNRRLYTYYMMTLCIYNGGKSQLGVHCIDAAGNRMERFSLCTVLLALQWISSEVEFVSCSMGTKSANFRKGDETSDFSHSACGLVATI